MVSVILVEPRHPGNIGSIARVMHNFGFSDLVLVDPLCSANDPDARRLAVHGRDILLKSRRMSFEAVRKEFSVLIATTSKVGTSFNLPRSPVHPDQLAEALGRTNVKKVGILFGRENDGLYNDEIKECEFSVTIPTPLENSALNLSHAVTVILYELSNASAEKKTDSHIDPPSDADRKQMSKMVNEVLSRFDYLQPGQHETQQLVWKRILAKAFLSKREAFAVMGFFAQLIKKVPKKDAKKK